MIAFIYVILDKVIEAIGKNICDKGVDIDLSAVFSFITIIISLYSVLSTNKGNDENRESNEKLSREVQESENRRAEKQIDANIIWNARIEWIHNVRRASAEYISVCYQYISAQSCTAMQEHKHAKDILNTVNEKSILLKLYFGPDSNCNEEGKAKTIDDVHTNNAKNEMIKNLIDEINTLIKGYQMYSYTVKRCEKESAKCAQCENAYSGKQYQCEKNEYGDKFTDEDCEDFKKRNEDERVNNLSKCELLHEDLEKLSKSLSIYLKIEWNHAKLRNNI